MENEEIEKLIAERQQAKEEQTKNELVEVKIKQTPIIAPNSGTTVQYESEISSDSVIEEQKRKDLTAIKDNANFIKLSKEINEREVGAKMQANANGIRAQELDNQYDDYCLKKQKEALDFRMKKERNVIAQQIKAELKAEKRRISETRFGYLYEEDGTYKYYEKQRDGLTVEKTAVKYKNFTPSYSINRLKEFQNWYKNQTVTVQKLIWTTVKFVLFGGVAVGAIFIIIKLLQWLATSGALGAMFGG